MKGGKKKTSLDLMKEVRTVWNINPRTRVHDNDVRKNRKKMRRDGRDAAKKALLEDNRELFLCLPISYTINVTLQRGHVFCQREPYYIKQYAA